MENEKEMVVCEYCTTEIEECESMYCNECGGYCCDHHYDEHECMCFNCCEMNGL